MNTNIIISPSILACPMLEYKQAFQTLNKLDSCWMHLDIMDGHFVPNLTFGSPLLDEIKNYPKIKNDVHLMVNNPDFYIEEWKKYPIHHISFHWEACTHHDRLLKRAKELYPSVGIALNPSTPIQLIPSYLFNYIDVLLIMSVNPGFYGQSFIDGVFDKVAMASTIIKSYGFNTMIQVDGGVGTKNIKDLIKRGATNFVVGAGFFKGQNETDWLNNYKQLLDASKI